MNAQSILGTIHNALNANIAFLDEATQYTTSFCNMLKIFLRHYNSIPMEVPNINKKIPMILRVEREHIIDNPEPTLTRSWQKIATAIFCNEPIESIIENLEKNLTVQISELKTKYSSKVGSIEQSIQNSCTDINNIEQQYQLLYQEYEKLCQSIEKFHGNPSQKDKYDKLKFKFKGTQKAAIDKLVELNHSILEYNLQIERSLTKFEEAEKEKFDDLYSCIFNFSKTLKNISEINKKITNNVSNEVSTISPQDDVDKFVDDSALQKRPSRIRLSRKGSISGSFSSTEAIIRLEQSLNAAKSEENYASSPKKNTASPNVTNTPDKTHEDIKTQEKVETQNNDNNNDEPTQQTQEKDEIQQDKEKEQTQPNENTQIDTKQTDINQQDEQKENIQENLLNEGVQENQQIKTRNIDIETNDFVQQNDQNEVTQQNEQKPEEPQQDQPNNELNKDDQKQEEAQKENESNQNDQNEQKPEEPQQNQQNNELNQNDQKQEETQKENESNQNDQNEQKQEEPQQDQQNSELNQNDQIQEETQKENESNQNDQKQEETQKENESNQNYQKQEETQKENESNQNDQKQEVQAPQAQPNDQIEIKQQDQPQNETDQKETSNQAVKPEQNKQNENQQIPLRSLSQNQYQNSNDPSNEITKFPSLTTSSGTEDFATNDSLQATSTSDIIDPSVSIDPEITFFEITKMFTFDVNKYLSPEEIFKVSLNIYNAVLTDDSGPFHKGDEVTVLPNESYKGITVIDHEGQRGIVELSKLQKIYERKIMRVESQIDEGELEVEVGEYVLVVNEREGFSKCLSAYREEGIIMSNKLAPYEPK